MSYRIDAEVTDCSYGCSYSKPKWSIEKDVESNFLTHTQTEFTRRKNTAIWFVSNCNPKFRLKFASELASHFPVNVIGYCARYVKPSISISDFVESFVKKCDRFSDCEKEEFARNKFFLSFESKNCSSYITEKFWRTLSTGLIPVVLQPARIYYELIAPPISFIHAQDFNYDPKKLANYLDKVSNDIELYRKHLAWKKENNVVYSQAQCERRRLCELCTKLNTETSGVYYGSVSKWFNQDCIVN